MGVSSFLLFVEGKAASPNVSRVLETIPVSWIDFDVKWFIWQYCVISITQVLIFD